MLCTLNMIAGDTDLSNYLKLELSKVNPSLQVDTVFNGIIYYMPVQKHEIQ